MNPQIERRKTGIALNTTEACQGKRTILTEALASALQSHNKLDLSASPDISLIRDGSRVEDGCAIFLIDRRYIAHVSPAAFPEVAIAEATAARTIREHLGQSGEKVIEHIAGGRIGERSYTITPLCEPLHFQGWARFFERKRVAPDILSWLERMTACGVEADAAFRTQCIIQTQHLASLEGPSASLRAAAHDAVNRLPSFPLRAVPMHGDLWVGNIMRRSDSLVVIDWGASLLRGYAIFDLLRFSESIRLPEAGLRKALHAHARLLGIHPEEEIIYLITALAHFATHLGEFPLERFIGMADSCYRRLQHALT